MKNINKILIFLVCITLVVFVASCKKNHTPEVKPHQCNSACDTCGGCTNPNCTEDACKTKCDGDHVDLPDIDIDKLK